MDAVRQFLVDRLAQQRLTMAEASKAIGRNHAYIQQFIERGVPKNLPEDVRDKLAKQIHCSPDDLKPRSHHTVSPPALPGGAQPFSNLNQNETFAFEPMPIDARHMRAKDVPVLGVAVGGEDGFFEFNGQVHEMTGRPAQLAGVTNAYALYVQNGSMAPRYKHGEIIYVNPNRPPLIGDCAVVQLRAAEGEAPKAIIVEVVKRTATKLVVRKYDPPDTRDIPLSQVHSIHSIVLSGLP